MKIAEDEILRLLAKNVQGLRDIHGDGCLVATTLQLRLCYAAEAFIVLNYQYSTHSCPREAVPKAQSLRWTGPSLNGLHTDSTTMHAVVGFVKSG